MSQYLHPTKKDFPFVELFFHASYTTLLYGPNLFPGIQRTRNRWRNFASTDRRAPSEHHGTETRACPQDQGTSKYVQYFHQSREGLSILCTRSCFPMPLYLVGIHPASSLCRWPSAWAVSSTWPASLWPCPCSHQACKHLSSAQDSNPCPQQPPLPHMKGSTCPQDKPHPSRRMGQGP